MQNLLNCVSLCKNKYNFWINLGFGKNYSLGLTQTPLSIHKSSMDYKVSGCSAAFNFYLGAALCSLVFSPK